MVTSVIAPANAQHGFHVGSVSLERQEFHLALNRDSQFGKPFFKQTFRLRLWEHKSIGIGALGTLHTNPAYDLVAGDDVNRIGLEPSINKRGGSATPIKQFEGTAPDREGCRPTSNNGYGAQSSGDARQAEAAGPHCRRRILLVLPRNSDAFYAAPGSTIKVGGGLGTPEVTE